MDEGTLETIGLVSEKHYLLITSLQHVVFLLVCKQIRDRDCTKNGGLCHLGCFELLVIKYLCDGVCIMRPPMHIANG